jgi:hydrogenase nickel incorporation protein HypB
MEAIHFINVKEQVFSKNANLASEIREELRERSVFLVNVMASPGSGKTSLILRTIEQLNNNARIGVIEGDIESQVDSEKIAAAGIPAVQLRTGGFCHLDANMVHVALKEMDLDSLDLIFVENIGNLVCPASFDLGAALKMMILSVPEGDDKIVKYPLMFSVVDCVVINKMDYLPLSNFDLKAFRTRLEALNPKAKLFEVSCQTGEGVSEWCDWLRTRINEEADKPGQINTGVEV